MSLSPVRLFATPCSRPEYWSGQPFLSPGDLPNPGIEPRSPELQADSLLSESQFSSVTQLCPTLCDPMDCSMPGLPVHHHLPELTQTHVHRVGDPSHPSNHLIPCHPLLLLPSIFPSIRVFSNESILHIWYPKYWSFSLSISPSDEYSGLISFRMDWLDHLAVQETFMSFPQYHSSKASILWCSAFFIIQLSHPYTITGKTIALTRWTFHKGSPRILKWVAYPFSRGTSRPRN